MSEAAADQQVPGTQPHLESRLTCHDEYHSARALADEVSPTASGSGGGTARPSSGLTVWSIGHSTRTLDQFLALLRAHAVCRLVDIRTVPRSRRHPHFDSNALALSMAAASIDYLHLPALGGFRRPAEKSPNTGWRNLSFRGYADYALTDQFAAGLAELRRLACGQPTAIMCSEAVWWRCHRRLVADWLVAHGDVVWHINSTTRASAHELTPFASVGPNGKVTYPVWSPG